MAQAKGVGKRFRKYRTDRGLSLRVAAEQLHTSHASIRDWEAGRRSPSRWYRDAIDRWSAGEVPANAWPLTPREAEIVKKTDAVRASSASE